VTGLEADVSRARGEGLDAVAEFDEAPKSAAVTATEAVTADEKRRTRDRQRKQLQRERGRDQDASHVENRPGGQPEGKPNANPFQGVRSRFGSWAKKLAEPIGVTEARRQLWHIHVGAARVLRSEAELGEDDFEEAAVAFEEMANQWPGFEVLRLVLRLAAPLILIGALWMVWAHILRETPWLQAWLDRRRRPHVVEDQPEPAPSRDPVGGAPPPDGQPAVEPDEHPPLINMARLRGR
jgi:hypothetical protein